MNEVANIVHRDIKPENILLMSNSNDWEIKICDFGLAGLYKGNDLKLKCGTPGYIAPEILKNE